MRRRTALVAAFAIALNALWPLLSHAKPAVPGVLVPVCTIEGVTHYLEVPGGKSPLDERASKHGEHCKLCVFGSEPALAPAPAAPQTNSVGYIVPRDLSGSCPQLLQAHPAQPRAPPAVS
jgi:hypothetical protein